MVSSITASELAERLDREEAFVLVDTRPAESYRSWHVPGTRNLPFKPGENLDADRLAEIDADADTDADVEILTICAEGVSSKEFAERLEAMGYDDVTLVEGGMAAWSAVYDVVPVPTDDETVEVLQVQRRAKGCLPSCRRVRTRRRRGGIRTRRRLRHSRPRRPPLGRSGAGGRPRGVLPPRSGRQNA
jgi:rhodanese-related sulfurtransferase